MILDEFKSDLLYRHTNINEKAKAGLKLSESIIEYDVEYSGIMNLVRINLYSLDILNRNDIDRKLDKVLFVWMNEHSPIRNSQRVERRTFCDFLRLNFGQSMANIEFIDSERPDYNVISANGTIGYEVTEATNAREAQFKKMTRLNTGRGKTKGDYKLYLKHNHKKFANDFLIEEYEDGLLLSPYKGMVDTCRTREEVFKAIVKKVKKYEEYEVDLIERNIIVLYSSLGYDNEFDFKAVGDMINREETIALSEINSIFVVSGLYNILVEYDKNGTILKSVLDDDV